MTLIDKILRLHYRQMANDRLRCILHLRCERFYDLFNDIQQLTRPSFYMSQGMWDFWLFEIMPKFVEGGNLKVLGYEVRTLI